VPVVVRSSFDLGSGTRIEEDGGMEGPRVEAIAHRADCAIVVAEGNAGGRGEARDILESVAGAFPELELVAHEQETDAHAALVWIGSPEDAEALRADFRRLRGPGGEWSLRVESGAAFVSLVGLGLSAREAARAEAALERAGIRIMALRATPGALVLRVAQDRVEESVRVLHAAFLE
jgi:aspartokinase